MKADEIAKLKAPRTEAWITVCRDALFGNEYVPIANARALEQQLAAAVRALEAIVLCAEADCLIDTAASDRNFKESRQLTQARETLAAIKEMG